MMAILAGMFIGTGWSSASPVRLTKFTNQFAIKLRKSLAALISCFTILVGMH